MKVVMIRMVVMIVLGSGEAWWVAAQAGSCMVLREVDLSDVCERRQ